MKRNYGFILGASDDIDRRTLQYLLNPPKLWEPEPSQIDRSHVTLSLPKDSAMSRSSLVTQRYLEEEKISWNIVGRDFTWEKRPSYLRNLSRGLLSRPLL